MQSGTASKLADTTALTSDIADLNQLDGMQKETVISDDNTKFPTSAAVIDYVAAQLAPIGGLEVIATEVAFPNTQPSAGVVISIADAGGIVVNGSGVSTTGRTVGGSTVTINNINSAFNSTTIAAGVSFMVSSTGSSQTYNFHKATLKESDILNLSNDLNDFGNRYRVNAGEPGSNNDEGDLVFDTSANKMKVYDGSSWGEVTSTGDFKFLVPVDTGTTTAATFDGSDTSFDLKETTNSGSAASVTNINQLIVSLNGVVQKPNTGSYSASEEGFYLTDADTIRFCTAPATGSTCFIIQCGSAVSIPTPGDGTVSAAKIASGAVTTVKVADGAITAAKLATGAASVTSDAQGNTVAGTNAGDSFSGTDAIHNTLYGKNAGTAITTGDYNIAVGSSSLVATTTGSQNVGIGQDAFKTNTTGSYNVAIGGNALDAATTASGNTAVGYASLSANTTGTHNTAVGKGS